MRDVSTRSVIPRQWGVLLVFALACRSNGTSRPPADGPGADLHTELASEASPACTCGSMLPAVSVGACLFSNPCPPSDFFRVSVRLDGVALPRDQTRADGWDYTNLEMTSIQLFGRPCQVIANGTATSLTFDYSCAGP